MTRGTRRLLHSGLATLLAVGLSGCLEGNIDRSARSRDGGRCGDLRIAVNPWTGYVANAHVIGHIAENRLGCRVTYPELKEEVSWQGMASGSVDTVVENWGHPDLVQKYVTEQRTVLDAGPTGNDGIIGWYVPPWMGREYPDITDWTNLNKYAGLFRTSESGGRGQLLDGDPSYVTNDEALVTNLKLDFKVVTGGSEAALITSFRQAEKNRTPLLAYFYEPQWFFNEMELLKVDLPPYRDGCDADPKTVACDYPTYRLNKLISARFARSGSPAVALVENFSWTNADQNAVAEMIADQGLRPEVAAQKWVAANPDKVAAWLR